MSKFKKCHFCNFKGYEIKLLVSFSLQKMQKLGKKSKFRASKCVKMVVFGPSKFLKMISRKI